jgi:hypothetical protein
MADSEELRKWKEHWLKKAMVHEHSSYQESRMKEPWDVKKEREISTKFQWKAVNRTRREKGNPNWLPGPYSTPGYIQVIDKRGRELAKRYMRMYKVEKT